MVGGLIITDPDIAHAGAVEEIRDIETEEIGDFDDSIEVLLPGEDAMVAIGEMNCTVCLEFE